MHPHDETWSADDVCAWCEAPSETSICAACQQRYAEAQRQGEQPAEAPQGWSPALTQALARQHAKDMRAVAKRLARHVAGR